MTAPTSDAVLKLAEHYPSFARQAYTIVSKRAGEGRIPFVFNRSQRRLWEHVLRSKQTRRVILKGRQMGITTIWLGFWLMCCLAIPGFRVIVMSLTGKQDGEISAILRDLYNSMPAAMLEGAPPIDRENDDIIAWKNGSRIVIHTQGGREVGRGFTFHAAQLTEYAKWTDPRDTAAAILPSITPSGWVVYEFTANGFNHAQELVTEAQSPDSFYAFDFFPWFWADEYQLQPPERFEPTYEEATLMAARGLTPAQITFRRMKQKELGPLFPQEFAEDAETCFVASGDSVFDFATIQTVTAECKEPLRTDGLLRVWEEPFDGVAYCIGADCGYGGPNGDYSAATVDRALSGRHVATLMDNPPRPDSRDGRMDQTRYAKELNDLGRYYNTAMIAVEGSGPGEGVLRLLEEVHHYPNLYRTGHRTGWYTTQVTKPILVARFRAALNQLATSTPDIQVARQMANYIVLERRGDYERTGARPGTHDDLMIAKMITNAVRSEAATLYESGSLLTVIPYGRR